MKTTLLAVTCMVTLFPALASGPLVRLYETIPPSSPNRQEAHGNIMADAISKGTASVPRGLNNPRHVHMPNVLQIGGVLFAKSGYDGLYDGTNNAAGPFYIEQGKAMASTFDYSDATAFPASSVTGSVLFRTEVNTWSTNIVIPSRFSSLFYGERWDANGNVIQVFNNGELVATQLVNRIVVFSGAYGFVVTPANLEQNLNYFRTHCALTNTFTFSVQTANGLVTGSNTLTSNPRVVHSAKIVFDGQRLPGFTFAVEKSTNLLTWTTVIGRATNGYSLQIPTNGQAYFRPATDTNYVVSIAKSARTASPHWSPKFGS